MLFEWDEDKNQSNYEKHGLWFSEAATIFEDQNCSEIYDPDSDPFEERFVTIGFSAKQRVLIVVNVLRSQCDNDDICRIISARKATKKERIYYEKGI